MAAFVKHLKVVSGLTLVSRVLGLARDAVLAHVLGATQDLVMSAYTTAFVYPNLLRRLFGEGALSAAFIPVFTEYLERGDRRAASRFMSLMITLLVAGLGALTLVVEGLLLVGRHLTEGHPKGHLIFGLAAVMFPFGITICLVALIQAALNCCKHFVAPALAPILLNVFIIAGAVVGAAVASDSLETQVYIVAASVLAAGIVQVLVQVPALARQGLRFTFTWNLRHPGLGKVLATIGPAILAFGIVQINTFVDSNMAYFLMQPEGGPSSFAVGGAEVPYPMELGAPAVLYYGQRLYNFPLGVFGIALATVIFPVLSRYAVRRDMEGLGRTAAHALRLTIFVGLPAGAGLILVAEPLLALWLNHGRFADDPAALARTVTVSRLYSLGIWAFCANQILMRAFYAMRDMRTPVRLAGLAAGANFVLNLVLIWPLAEGGLAVATVTSAAVQTVVLALVLGRRSTGMPWGEIGASAARTLLATAGMFAATAATMYWAVPATGLDPGGTAYRLAQLGAGVGVGVAVFAGAAWLLGMTELRDLLKREIETEEDAEADTTQEGAESAGEDGEGREADRPPPPDAT